MTVLESADLYRDPVDLLDEMEAETGIRDLPVILGYRILVKVYIRPEKSAGGVVYADQTREEDNYQSSIGKVVGMGPQAYAGTLASGEPRFPDGPWCKLRDWVLVPRYDGAAFKFAGVWFIAIPDDKILAVIKDPSVATMRPRQLR